MCIGILKNTKEMIVHVESDYTQELLEKNGFNWSTIDEKYILNWKQIGH